MKAHFYFKSQSNQSNDEKMYKYRVFYILVLKTWSLDVECLFQKESEMADGCPFFL